jgi:AraC family transcriptional regulator
MHPIGSYARLRREECGSRPEEPWSEKEWPRVFALKDSFNAMRLPNGGSGRADWTVGLRRFPTKPATTDSASPVEKPPSVVWNPTSRWEEGRLDGLSTDQLLDDLRRAIERNPEATRGAVAQLVTFLSPSVAIESVSVRGGLAPWQKRKVDRYLRENLDRPVRLDAVAEQVALSVSYFSRAFKETFGTTPHMHMLRMRVELAQKLMLATEEPLSQIALACGLADQAHLSKLFRRVVGETPSAWRRRNLTDSQAEGRRRGSTRGQFALPDTGSRGMAAPP